MYETNKRNKTYPSNVLTICEAEDGIFYFDMNEKREDGEYSIYEFNSQKIYANDFVDFLKKRIEN